MSRSLNEVTLIGNVGQTPDMKNTSGGKRYALLSIATTRSFKDAQGEWQEKTDWHRVKAWAKTAEIIEKYVNKGDRIYIRAHLEYSQSGEGDVKKYYTDIVASDVILLGNRPSGDSSGPKADKNASGSQGSSKPAATTSFPESETVQQEDDDLPF